MAVGRRAVYFASYGGTPSTPGIFVDEVEIASGRQKRLAALGVRQPTGVALAPDGRSVVVAAINAVGADLMVVEPSR